MLLPYDSSCPVIHDNDTVIDVYTEDFLMAAASLGELDLRGIVTSSSVRPFNPHIPESDFHSDLPPAPNRLNFVANRTHGVRLAREAGLSDIPDPIMGIKGNLQRPDSGKIEDTAPVDSPGTRLVLETALSASPEKPLVLIMGGQASIAADAYLLDPGIADRMVVAWLVGDQDGLTGYNASADPWAAYIVLERLRLVAFPTDYADPRVSKERLHTLPESAYRQWLIDKQHPGNRLPDGRDADAQPAISVLRGDYVKKVRPVACGSWSEGGPLFTDAGDNRAMVVTEADGEIATSVWWQIMQSALTA